MFLQSTVLLGLFATSFALPAPEAAVKTLLARAPLPASVNCEGRVFTVNPPASSTSPRPNLTHDTERANLRRGQTILDPEWKVPSELRQQVGFQQSLPKHPRWQRIT